MGRGDYLPMNLTVTIRTADWKAAVSSDARLTQRLKDNKPLTLGLWRAMLHAEHSPIRSLEFALTFEDIPYWVTAHLDRHHVGVQPFQGTQRPDAKHPVPYDRNAARQDAPVTLRLVTNVQALIYISRRRLCTCAAPETRQVWSMVKAWMEQNDDPFLQAIGELMMPDCQYRGNVCHEFESCGLAPHWTKFL